MKSPDSIVNTVRPTKRLFVAIEMPEATRKVLVDLNPHLPGVYWTDPSQLHLTLGFFGNVPEMVDLPFREKLGSIKFGGFFLPIEDVGTFPPNRSPKIIWVGVGQGHPHLFQIHKRVQEAALAVGIEPDLRPWHPHVTVARCRDVSWHSVREFLRRNVDLHVGLIRVDAFHLFCSELRPTGTVHTCEMSIAAT